MCDIEGSSYGIYKLRIGWGIRAVREENKENKKR